jgi:hypothetical protein
MPKGRRKKYCACGCQERLDLQPDYSKRKKYVNVAHRQQAARLRKWTAPIRRHRLIVAVDIMTQSKKLVGVSVHVGDPVLVTPENISGAQG